MVAALLTDGRYGVRVRVTDSDPKTVQFDKVDSRNDLRTDHVILRDETDKDERQYTYYYFVAADGAVWLAMPAPMLFRSPTKARCSAGLPATKNNVSYYLTALQDYQSECAFLLGRPAPKRCVSPGGIGVLEELSRRSYSDAQHVTTYFTEVKNDPWSVTKRTITTAALALLRGYGIRRQHYWSAATKVAEYSASTMHVGWGTGSEAAPVYYPILPTIMTYGIQGLRTMNSFGAADPKELGLGKVLTGSIRQLGLLISVGNQSWQAMLHNEQLESDVNAGDTTEDLLKQAGLAKVNSASVSVLKTHQNNRLGEQEWRPTIGAACYTSNRTQNAESEIVKCLVQFGSNVPLKYAGMRTRVGNGLLREALADRIKSLGDGDKSMLLHYQGGVSVRLWHALPQDSNSSRQTREGLGDAMETALSDEGVAIRALPPITVQQPGELDLGTNVRVRNVFTYPIGCPEHTLAMALETARLGCHRMDEAITQASLTKNTGQEVAALLAALPFTPDLTVTFEQKAALKAHDRVTVSGEIPACTYKALAMLVDSDEMAPVEDCVKHSGYTTSMSATRALAKDGKLSFNLAITIGQVVTRLKGLRGQREPTISLESGMINRGLEYPAGYAVEYNPLAPTLNYPAPLINCNGHELPPARYHKTNDVPVLIRNKIANFEADTEEGSDGSKATKAIRHIKQGAKQLVRPRTVNRKAGGAIAAKGYADVDTFNLRCDQDNLVRVVVRREPGAAIAAPHGTRLVYKVITGMMQLLAEVINNGLDDNMQLKIQERAIQIATKDGTTLRGATIRHVGGCMNGTTARGLATFEDAKNHLKTIGVMMADRWETPLDMAGYLMSDAWEADAQLITAFKTTRAGKTLERLEDNVKAYVADGENIGDTQDVACNLAMWVLSPDTGMQVMARESLRACAAQGDGVDNENLLYAYDMDEVLEDMDQDAVLMLEKHNEMVDQTLTRAGGAKGYQRRDQTLTWAPSLQQVMALPAMYREDTLFYIHQMNGRTQDFMATSPFASMHLTSQLLGTEHNGEATADIPTKYAANVVGGNLVSADPRSLTLSYDNDLHKAGLTVMVDHLKYAARLWAPVPNEGVKTKEMIDAYTLHYKPTLDEAISMAGNTYDLSKADLQAMREIPMIDHMRAMTK
jgi:hypothetical protein